MDMIKKRSVTAFVILNILTFGIYGLIVNNKMGQEVDMICEGDNETEVSYIMAWLLGIVTGGIYLQYWWYKQANRMKVNAGRYGLVVRESGLDLLLHRIITSGTTVLLLLLQLLIWPGIFLAIINKLTMQNSLFGYGTLDGLYGGVYGGLYGGYVIRRVASVILGSLNNLEILLLVCMVIIAAFGGLLSHIALAGFMVAETISIFVAIFSGASGGMGVGLFFFWLFSLLLTAVPFWTATGYLGMGYFMKNLNRFADVYSPGQARPYDPMAYEYYHAQCNYPSAATQAEKPKVNETFKKRRRESADTVLLTGAIIGKGGENKGYTFELVPGEEMIIGKDPGVSSIIISPQYKEISRKHCGITYEASTNMYCVTDYSSNGTFVENGKRLAVHVSTMLPPGTVLRLGTTENVFELR